MSQELRARGQETTLHLVRGNKLEDAITAIRNSSNQLEFKTIAEGYLGEVTNRHDDIFDGTSGSFEAVPEGREIFVLVDFLMQRSERKLSTPLSQNRVNKMEKFVFPNGDQPKILIPDMKFDPIGINIPARDQYVAVPLSWKADTAKIVLT